jgi:hypothetical protein
MKKGQLTNDQIIKIYSGWISRRLKRPNFIIPTSEQGQKELGLKNYESQHVLPRKDHLEDLKAYVDEFNIADIVSLLVKLELPVVETTTLLTKLNAQLTKDPKAVYFSRVNQNDNCGCGCGCNCFTISKLRYEDRINQHKINKPHSIDPFNELGIPEKGRDELLIKDFLSSYKRISRVIAKEIESKL